MEFKKLESKYLKDAVRLAIHEYESECAKCEHLIQKDFKYELTKLIAELFESKYGMVALNEDELIGYLVFEGPWDGFFGKVKGAFSPLGGSAFGGNERNKLASLLFQNVSELLVEDEICSIAVCRYAHDYETAKSFVMNGFGIRCSDSIRDLSIPLIAKCCSDNITYMELEKSELKNIVELKKDLAKHLCKGPIFFPPNLNNFEEWLNRNTNRIYVAKENNNIIGYIEIGVDGENFITDYNKMLNICGAYFNKEYRNSGIPTCLIEYVIDILKKEGINYLGVDCETLNPNALRFWGKHFDNYTYSFARRIDERIIGYDKYLESACNKF